MSTSNRLTQLLADWESGNSHFDRGALAKALGGESPAEVEAHARQWLYRWLILGPAKRDAPQSFESFVGTMPAPETTIEADVSRMLSQLGREDDATAATEARGLIEYLCVKSGARYEPRLCAQLAPLLQAAWDCSAATADDAAAASAEAGVGDLKVCFNLWLEMRQRLTYPAAINLKSFRDVLDALLSLILQYHDPLLALHVERNKLDLKSTLIDSWLPALYSSCCATPSAALRFLDECVLLRDHDEAVVPMLGIAVLIHARDVLIATQSPEDLAAALDGIALAEGEIADVVAAARRMLSKTPFSARRQLRLYVCTPIDAATLSGVADDLARLREFVVLPIDADELTDGFACAVEGVVEPRPQHLNYVVLDCRAEKSFHHARLPTAVHVGNYIGFDPAMLQRMVSEFESARGSHLCVLGTGRGMLEEINLLKVIGLAFVQAGYSHVSFAEGGFKACVPRIKAGRAEVVRTPQRVTSTSEASTAAAGSPSTTADGDHAAAPRAASATAEPADAGKPGDAGHYYTDEAKEKLRVAQQKANDGLKAAKSWGMGLYSRWRKAEPAPSSTDAAQPSDAAKPAPDAGSARTAPTATTAAAQPAGTSSSSPAGRGSAGAASTGSGASPAPKAPTSLAAGPAAELFGFEDDDEDDFGLVTSVPQKRSDSANDVTTADQPPADEPPAAAAAEEPAAVAASPADEPPAEKSVDDKPSEVPKDEEAPAPAEVPADPPAATAAPAPKSPEVAPAEPAPAADAAPAPKPKVTGKSSLSFLDDPFADDLDDVPLPKPKPGAKKASSEPHPFDDIFT